MILPRFEPSGKISEDAGDWKRDEEEDALGYHQCRWGRGGHRRWKKSRLNFLYIDEFSKSLHVEYKNKGIDVQCQAVNEATFRCPDELGWKPQKVAIVASDGCISRATMCITIISGSQNSTGSSLCLCMFLCFLPSARKPKCSIASLLELLPSLN